MPKGMEYMKGYGNGYKPPSGSAGVAAKGEFSSKSNPKPVPMKGSQISMSQFGRNADKEKMVRLKKEQEMNEKLRGYGC